MLNKFEFIGNLTRDVVLRHSNNNKAVCNLDIALNYYVQNEKKTEYVQVTVWEKQAEDAAKYLKKGRQVFTEGRVVVRKRQLEGKNISIPEFHATTVLYLGPSTNSDQQGSERNEQYYDEPPYSGSENSHNPFVMQNGGGMYHNSGANPFKR